MMLRLVAVATMVVTLLSGTILAADESHDHAAPAEATLTEDSARATTFAQHVDALPPGYLPVSRADRAVEDEVAVAGKCASKDKCARHGDGKEGDEHGARAEKGHEHPREVGGRRTISRR